MEEPNVDTNSATRRRPALITLRPFSPSDAEDFMVWATDERANIFLHWDASASREEALHYFHNRILIHPWRRAICLESRPIGVVTVKPGGERRASIGYVLGSAYWGQGIATRAVKMVLSLVFHDLPHLERLEGVADVQNPASQRVLEKAGFFKEGLLRKYFLVKGVARDVIMYSFLSTDPKPELDC